LVGDLMPKKMDVQQRREVRTKKRRVPKVQCQMCGKIVRATKIKMLPFKSKREGMEHFNLKVCRECYNREMEARKKGQASNQAEERLKQIQDAKPKPEPEPEIKEPIPQSLENDKDIAGFIHKLLRINEDDIPIYKREHGEITIDANRLSLICKNTLGADLMREVQQMSGEGKCYEVNIKSIKFEYKLKHP